MPRVSPNGVEIHYEVFGAGKDIVLCHGFTASHQDWSYLMADLVPGYRLVAMDHRGHGSSQAPSSPDAYSIGIFASDVLGVLARTGVNNCCLIGHSMGGFIALELALSHPELIAALILVDTSSGEMDTPSEHARVRQKGVELARNEGMEVAFEYVAANSPMTKEYYRKHPQMKDILRQRTIETSVDAYVHTWRALWTWAHVTARLSEIKAPTVVVVGDEDIPFLRPSQVLGNQMQNAKLVVMSGSGHSPHLEQPARFNSVIRDFLSSHYPPD